MYPLSSVRIIIYELKTYYVFGQNGEVLYEQEKDSYLEYVYILGKHFARVDGTLSTGEKKTYFYHTDHLGSTVLVTDEAGEIVWSTDYTPFGQITMEEGTLAKAAKFTGKDLDEDTGLYYFNARWYDSEIGRFISEDPAADPNNPNLYTYCANNPLMFVDPDGLEAIVISGGHAGYESHFLFIETGINAIKTIQENMPEEKITWLVADSGYSKLDKMRFATTAECHGVELIIVSSKEDIVRYINTKNESEKAREEDKITHIEVFSHGMAGVLLLGYQGNSEVNFEISDIEKLDSKAFDKATTWFGSCNTGTDYKGGDSFAQVWSNKTGGISTAVVGGQTTYRFINEIDDNSLRFKKMLRGLQRRLINYSADGSFNYPTNSVGVSFKEFYPNKGNGDESKRENDY